MTAALGYSVLAVLLILGFAAILRRGQEEAGDLPEDAEDYVQDLWDPAGLDLAERIFDSADYLWLRDGIGLPRLAKSLYEVRRQMALEWLKAVRQSFEDLLRTPEPPRVVRGVRRGGDGWLLLRQVLRFHLVLSYADFVVRFFGPYHSLVPPFGRIRVLWGAKVHEDSPKTARLSTPT